MDVELQFGCDGVDWTFVFETLKRVGMAHFSPEQHRQAFEASSAAVFAYSGNRLVGFARALSDGACQAAIYDVAVVPEFQRNGFGARLVQALLARLEPCNVILYAAPGKEDFYRKLGFRKMKTGMALFPNAAARAQQGFTD
ncbi:MAG: GNAT family N-acetyltransferase [Opitutae bacterium]|nr:GNAT family N-acetyltransferase [Opitutae bacterium]